MEQSPINRLLEKGWSVAADTLLNDPAIHKLTKDTIQAGLNRDPLDAAADVALALAVLEKRRDYILNALEG